MSAEGMVISVRMPEYELAALDEEAEAAGLSRSELVRRRISSLADPGNPVALAIELLPLLEGEIGQLSEARRLCCERRRQLEESAEELEKSGDEEGLELARECMLNLDGLHGSTLEALEVALSCRKTVRQALGLE